jgi:hypothetical protein
MSTNKCIKIMLLDITQLEIRKRKEKIFILMRGNKIKIRSKYTQKNYLMSELHKANKLWKIRIINTFLKVSKTINLLSLMQVPEAQFQIYLELLWMWIRSCSQVWLMIWWCKARWLTMRLNWVLLNRLMKLYKRLKFIIHD